MRSLVVVFLLIFSFSAEASQYLIDVSHSSVGFKVKHLMISTVSGRFDKFSGTGDYDEKTGAISNLQVNIETKSINTNHKKRDKHLRNKDFFDVKKFPKITFQSSNIITKNKRPIKIEGELTLLGTKRPIVFDVEFGGVGIDPWGNKKLAFVATSKINRKDFGMKWNKALDSGGVMVSDEVTITVEIEANGKK